MKRFFDIIPIISIINEKGGVGKTTLATHIARGLEQRGRDVLLIDSDPQGSLRDWFAAAGEENDLPPVIAIDRSALFKDLQRAVGLNPGSGTGPRSDAYRLRKQMEKLFRATISLEIQGGVEKGSQSWLDMQIAPIGEFWWNSKLSDENAIFKSWVELGEKFYSSILNNPVPLDMEALKALRHSPLALDLYAWASYKTYSLIRSNKHLNVSWEELAMQLGADYGRMIGFKRSALRALVKVQEVYQGLRVSESDDGLILKPGALSVPQKSQISSPRSLFKFLAYHRFNE